MNVHKLNFDTAGNVENITFVLAYKSGEKIGNITNVTDIVTKHPLNSYSEFSFIVHKKLDNNTTPLWDKLTDFKLAWIPEWDMWFEITVELNEDDETIKNVSGITIGEAELSQIMLYNIEINTETDIARDEYVKPTIFYNPSDKSSSLVDRLMEKAPHFKFVHIDSSLMNIQRTYTFDGKSIYDALKEIEKEMNCMFVFHSGSNEDGSIQRGISVFDLEANCLACGHRNTFVDKCPSCGSTNIKHGFGEYTNVFISKENLATEITYSTDTDSVKNCFKLEAGDDLMTAAVRSCNPNGTDYIYYFPDKIQQDMSPELRAKLASYDKLYDEYNQTHKFTIDSTFVDKYNTLVNKYKSYEDTLTPITLPIVGYPKLTKIYFDTIDMAMFLRHRLMPNITKPANTAKGQGDHLVANLPHLAATTSLKSLSVTTADNIIITLANSIVKGAFKITIVNSSLSNNIWRGNFKINSYADETDTYTTPVITITITESYEEYIKQRLDKLLNSEDKNYYDISGLFKQNLDVFRSELHKYCLTSLSTFQKCCQSCIDIMVQQGVSSTAQKNQIFDGTDLYNKLYTPYYQKLNAIQNEIIIREGEIEIIEGYRNNQNELVRSGLQVEIEKIINTVHNTLNFEKYIGKKLHGEFSSFVRMDKYSNYNYISDGLNNTELLKNALDFMVTAQKELFKSATLQHSISGNLKNLLLMREFKPIVNSFKNGNWILVEVDGTVYQLRIIEYTIDFSNNKTIDVRFSDVVSTADGLSDLENILSNAANMTKSYAGIIKQSEINTNFRKDMSEMIIKGLDMTNTKIVSNADNQDITWDEHGLLCREYNDILSDYNPCQLKIINHGVYLTTDKWKTAKAGIGRFLYFDPKDNKYKEGYGVIADTLVGNLILSSEVGIYNEEKSIEMDKNGIVVTTNTYNKNVFTIQKELKDPDGNISYQRQLYIDDNGNIVLGGGASISWDNVTGTDHIVTDVDAEKLKNDITAIFNQKINILEQQIDGKVQTFRQPNDPSVDWNTPELKNNHSGDLWYNTDTNETFMYNGNSWDAFAGEVPQELWDKVDGKAQIFTTTTPPTPPYHKGDLWFAGANADIKTCITTRESGSYVESDWKKYNKYTDDTKVDDVISGLGFTTSITGTKVISPHIVGGDLKIGNPNSGTYYASIDTLGKLTATGADIKGKIIATEGMIGNFNISNAIWNGMNSFNSGNNGVYLGTDGIALGGGKFKVTSGGKLTASGVDISGNINAESGTIGGFNITSVKNDNDHAYGQTLYRQVKNVYENGSYYDYQAGIKGKNTSSSSTEATEAAFYIRKKLSSDTWANSTIPFYVRNNGYVYAENMNIGNALYSTGVQRSESGLESKRYKVMESWVEKVAFGMLDKAYDNYATFNETGAYLWSKGNAVKVACDRDGGYIELSPELDTTVAYLGNAFETWEKLYVQNIGDTGTPVNSGYFTNLYTKVNGVWTKVTGTSGGGTTAPTYTAGDGINISSNRISVTLAGEDSGGLKFNNYGNIAISTSFLNSRYSQINHTHSSSSITWSGLKSSNGDNNGHVHRGINNSSGYGLWINGSTMIYPASNADGGLNTTTVTDLNSGIDLGGRTVPFKGGYFKKLYLRNTDIESLFYLSVSGNTLYLKNNIDNSTISNVTLPSGGGGSSNYNDLNNKPSINSVTLSGNQTLDNLGIGSKLSLYGTTLYLEKSNGSTISSVNLSSLSGGGGSSIPDTIETVVGSIRPPVGSGTGNNNEVDYVSSPNTNAIRLKGKAGGTSYIAYTVTGSSSDVRLKNNISNSQINGLNLINSIKVRQFNWIQNNEYQKIGFIADELEMLDEKLTVGGGYEDDGTMLVKTVDSFYLQGYEIKAIQELSQINQQQKLEIQELKNTLLSLQGELSILKQKMEERLC